MRHFIAAASVFALAACGLNGTDRYKDETKPATTASAAAYPTMASDNLADPMASHDGQQVSADVPDPEQRPVMQAQVALDRVGFGPGVIDGKMGMSTHNALKGFQEAKGLKVSGEIDDATKQAMQQWQSLPATRVVTIPADWGQAQYYKVPDKPEDQAKMQRLGYSSLDERLAERFHTTLDVLKQLNPDGRPAGMTASTGTLAPGDPHKSDAIGYALDEALLDAQRVGHRHRLYAAARPGIVLYRRAANPGPEYRRRPDRARRGRRCDMAADPCLARGRDRTAQSG